MVEKIFKSPRLVFKPFNQLTAEEQILLANSWSNPFNMRYNYESGDQLESIKHLSSLPEPTFQNPEDCYDWMYYRAVFSQSGDLIGSCRFGEYSQKSTHWDFGFNVLLKHWFKGYGAEMVAQIKELARENKVQHIRGGADKENYGSYKAMIKNGFVFIGVDSDGDFEYDLDLSKASLSQEEINQNWQNHIEMTKQEFGEDKVQQLEANNKKIQEMVARIKAGEDEVTLVKKYFEELYGSIEDYDFR